MRHLCSSPNSMVCTSFQILLLFTSACTTAAYGTKNAQYSLRVENYEQLYRRGKDAYLENNYKGCVKYIEEALRDYKEYNNLVNHCKLSCKKNNMSQPVVLFTKEYAHYEGMIRETLCLLTCKRGKINPSRREEIIDQDLVKDFETMKIYDYLQLCYFQIQEHQKAANAAYTNSIFVPDHEVMRDNLRYYLNLPGVQATLLINLEEQEYVGSYRTGKKLYAVQDWEGLVQSMERALALYLKEEELCRVQCEKPFNMGWYPDFVSSVSNHFTFCLKCKLNCATQLHSIDGHMEEELIPLFYHYLQFGYYKLLNYSGAVDSSMTYLELRPEDADMLNNLQFYRAASGIQGKVREEAVHYIERERDELALLHFIEDSFVFNEDPQQHAQPENKAEDSTRKVRTEDKAADSTWKVRMEDKAEDSNWNVRTADLDEGVWAEWSSTEGKYLLSDVTVAGPDVNREDDGDSSESFIPSLLVPPPLVKFEL